MTHRSADVRYEVMDTYGTILYFVCLLGGVGLIIRSSLWSMRHPRKKGEPLSRERKTRMVLPVLGAILIVVAVISL